jgi:hypothetical protein
VGLPRNTQPQNTNFDGNKADGEFQINLQGDTPVGTYTFHLIGTSQVNYARNPESAKAATERKAAVDKLAAELATLARQTAEAKNAAEQKHNQATAAAQNAAQQKQNADQAAQQAAEAAQQAAEAAKNAQSAAEAAPNDQNLANARQAAAKTSEEAAAKAKQAADAKAAADKTAEETAAAAKKTEEEKAAAEKAAAEADQKAKQIAEFQQNFNQQVNDLVNRAKPQPYQVGTPSTTVTLKITPAPITLSLPQQAVTLKQGVKVDVPLTIGRLYNFNEAVPVRAKVPDGVGGLNIPQAMIAQGQSQGVMPIEANAEATPGVHKLVIQAVPRLNNQELLVEQPLALTIEKVEKK